MSERSRADPLAQRIVVTPRAHDAGAANRTLTELRGASGELDALAAENEGVRALIEGVLGSSPYLARLIRRAPARLAAIMSSSPEAHMAGVIERLRSIGEAGDESELMAGLRGAKDEAHLAIALADIAGAWSTREVTAALSDFADAAIIASLSGIARGEAARGRLSRTEPGDAGLAPGYFVIAMGKLGSTELNFSSDVDLVVFFDRDRLLESGAKEPARTAIRMTQSLVRVLQDPTQHGYALRVDLRLRPDPGATSPAITTEAALRYYESLAQSWERAAFIKARICAGDFEAGEAFLSELSPFVWRRSLDYTSLDDIKGMMRQIRSVGERTAGVDVKRGRGGIRELEFYVQSQQLIFGGREPELRGRGTMAALNALAAAGHVARDTADVLGAEYDALRRLEHRLQMIDDQQTHAVPADPAARARVAALCADADLAAFDARLADVFASVVSATSHLFSDDREPANPIVIDAVGDDAEATIEALSALGFSDPSDVADTVRAWRAGRIRATRSERARRLLRRFLPGFFEAAAESGAADLAFSRFRSFFERLPAGVQILSLLVAEPQLLKSVVKILALSPKLGAELARQPAALDVMLDPSFALPLDDSGDESVAARVRAVGPGSASFEDTINALRRVGREEAFRIGAHVLLGRANAQAAGAAYAALADASIEAAVSAAAAEMERRHGVIDGEFAVLGLGKLGGREMSAASDLDLMLIYRAATPETASEGARPLVADVYFARLTQRLIAALSAPTEEGALFEVDLQLRPSGSKGPIAVRLAAFEHYYDADAWTWELLALTRARPVAGAPGLIVDLEKRVREVLRQPRDAAAIAADVADMRERVARERPGAGPWDLKLAPGGLMDVEFSAQYLQLAAAHEKPSILAPGTIAALENAAAAGAADKAALDALLHAARLQLDLTQILAVATDAPFDPEAAPDRLKELLCKAVGAGAFDELQERLVSAQGAARGAFEKLLAHPAS